MQLTRYTDYSIRVLTHLSTYPQRLSCIAEIAGAYQISQSHLMKVVQDLGQSGYVETVRGRNGGIRLRKAAEDINLGALVRHTEKHFDIVDCPRCLISPACQMTDVFTQATRAFLAVLDQYTLADMMTRRNHLHRLFFARAYRHECPLMKHAVRLAVTVALLVAGAAGLSATALGQDAEGYDYTPERVTPPAQSVASTNDVLVYDHDYPFIHYGDPPVHNEIARLQKRIDAGLVKLVPTPQHGYLEAVLAALKINPDSQVLVFSKTSLQVDAISVLTPRAIYFDDDTYVAWVQKTGMLEIVTMDADRGAVFYTIHAQDPHGKIDREMFRCLTCHDTYSEMGGGVPRFLFESVYDLDGDKLIPDAIARETTDETPIAQRWGGWYVTGNDGGALNLGNILPPATHSPINIDKVRRGSLPSLSSILNTSAYLRSTGDIVALLVLQHQVTLHNAIVHANYKTQVLLHKLQPGSNAATLHWAQLTPKLQGRYVEMLRPLVDALLMANAAPLTGKVTGSNGYAASFQARGPKDPQGRSLRQLDLNTRVFRYPVSFLIYSEGFDALPLFAREHVYTRLAQILRARDPGSPYNRRSLADRQAAFDILMATKPEFARQVSTLGN